MSNIKHNSLLSKKQQIETQYFKPWETNLKNSEADLTKREREAHEHCMLSLNLLKTYKSKLRKFNYQYTISEFFGLDRIDRLAQHLERKINQYNEYCKIQQLICESDKLDVIYLVKERKILLKERSEFYKQKQLFIRSKHYKL